MNTEFTMTKQQFYIASLVCVCVLIVAAFYGWFSGRTNDNGMNDIGGVNISGEADAGQAQIQDTNAAPEKNPTQDNEAGTAETAATGSGIVVSAPKYALPAEGSILRDFSNDTLIYYKTLDQYMVHPGVDIGMPAGTQVCAAADGLISKVMTEDEMGVTVWVAHPGEVTIVYSNLTDAPAVEEGDEIFRGDVIGTTGDTSMYEKNEEPHLHLEVLLNGVQVDPKNYFQF